MTRNTVALYDMVVSVSPTSAAWLLLVAGQSWPMTADSAFGLGALPNRAMQVMPPRCLYPGAPPSGRATRPHAPGCCSGSGAQTDGWDCRDPQCRMRVTVVSRADYCAGPYRYGCSAPRARPSRRHCHRQFRTDLDKLDHRPAMTGWISTSSIITLDRTCAWRNWASRHSAAGWGSEFDRRGHRR